LPERTEKIGTPILDLMQRGLNDAGLRISSGRAVLIALASAVELFAVSWAVKSLLQLHPPESATNAFKLAVVSAFPVFEEFIFRGLLIGFISAGIPDSPKKKGTFLLFGFSTFLFAAAHMDSTPALFAIKLLQGAVYALFFLRTRSLLPPVICHISVNLLSLLL
jgi:membrane protease YdiL (CAAX protease family)